jgi:toxin FitB
MILLDINVVSEPQRQEPNAHVLDWLDGQALETLYLSAMTVAELRAGISLMPAGKRRDSLHENLEKRLLPLFANRVLSFDIACTSAYAELLAAWLSLVLPDRRLPRRMPSLQPSP